MTKPSKPTKTNKETKPLKPNRPMKLKEYIRKIYNRFLCKKPRREIWGRQFDGYADIPAGKEPPKNKKKSL